MPYYDYRCRQCDVKFEELTPVSQCTEDRPCPDCGGDGARIISPVHFDGKMGLDPDFSTFSDRWAKNVTKRHQGDKSQKDSNDHRYGGEHEK